MGGMITGVVRQAIVSAACKMADIWPFAVKIFVRSRSYRSLSRIVILFTTVGSRSRKSNTLDVARLGCTKHCPKKSWTVQGIVPRSCWVSGNAPGMILQPSWSMSHSWLSTRFAKSDA